MFMKVTPGDIIENGITPSILVNLLLIELWHEKAYENGMWGVSVKTKKKIEQKGW